MLALVKTSAAPGLELHDVPRPHVGINDVLVRVHKTGICGTDLHIDAWDAWARRTVSPPLVVGHEFVGTIEEVGSNVADFAPGELVSGEGHVVCGRCRHCLAGRRELCPHTIGLGIGRDGAFAELVVLPMTNVWHHWQGIDADVAAVFDPLGNAVHTALAFPVLGEDVLVTGAGPTGLMATAVARHAGARHVVVSEPNAYRRRLAVRMGATLAIDPRERGLGDVFAELDMVEGFDVVLEMSGNPDALRSALAAMAHGGGVAILGLPTEEISLDVGDIVRKMLTIRGIYGREMYETWYKMTVMLRSGLDITPVITHRFHFTEHRAAFAAARSGESGKVILDWTRDRSAGVSRRRGGRPAGAAPVPRPAGADQRAGPGGRCRRPARDQPVVERLPRPDWASPAAGGGPGRSGRVRRGLRGGAHDRRHPVDAPGAGGGAGRVQGRSRRPHFPVRLHRQHRTHPHHHRRGRPDRLRQPQPRVDHRRRAAVQGGPQGLSPRRRRRAAGGARRGQGRVPARPRRHRRGVQHGRRHRPAAGHRGSGRGGGRSRPRRRRPRLRCARPRRAGHRRPLRAARPGPHPGRHAVEGGRFPRRLRRRLHRPPGDPDPAGPALPVLDVPSTGGGRRLPGGAAGHAGRAGAPGAAVGQHPPVQGRAGPPGLRHRPLRDADHAGPHGRPRDGHALLRPLDGPRGLRPARGLPDRGHGQGPHPHDRHRRPHR